MPGRGGEGEEEQELGQPTVLHAVELPAGVAHLDTGLAHVHGDAFPHLG